MSRYRLSNLVLIVLGALVGCSGVPRAGERLGEREEQGPARAGVPGGEKGSLVPMKVSRQALDQVHAGRRLALVVGIGRFQDPEWRALRYAQKDATDVAAVLRDGKKGAFDKVFTLNTDSQGTLAAVQGALRALAEEVHSPEDTVVVYFSSHGTLARDSRGELRRYLVTRDTKLSDVPGTALSMDALRAGFESLPSRKKLLMLATCHSGTGKSLLPKEVQKELAGIKAGFFVRPLEETSRASIVLAACDWGETAREDERLGHDIYTYFFLQALVERHDRNGDGAVTATEAHDYARRQTYSFTNGRQRPSAETLIVGTDPVVLVGNFAGPGRPELFSYHAAMEGFRVSVDGVPRGQFPGAVAMKEGTHRVQISKGGGSPLVDRLVSLNAGQRLSAEELLRAEGPRPTLAARGGALGVVGQGGVLPSLALSLRLPEVPLPRLSLVLDASLARSAGAGVTGRAMSAGLAVPYSWVLEKLTVLAGPRLALVHLDRPGQGPQITALTPGAMASVGFPLGSFLEATAGGHLGYLLHHVNGSNQGLALGELWAGVGYRF